MQGSYITYGGRRLMAITPGQGMIIDPTGTFSSTDPDSDVWNYLPIPTSEPWCCRGGDAGVIGQPSRANKPGQLQPAEPVLHTVAQLQPATPDLIESGRQLAAWQRL